MRGGNPSFLIFFQPYEYVGWIKEQELRFMTIEQIPDVYLYPSPIAYELVVDKMENIKEELDVIELLRTRLLGSLQEYREMLFKCKEREVLGEYIEDLIKSANDGTIEAEVLSEEIVKLSFHFKLPHYPKTLKNKATYYDMLLTYYHKKMFNALEKVKSEWPSFQNEKVVVYIKSFYKDKSIRDLDNRFHSFIFNSLRYSQLIEDDGWQYLSYMEEGFLSSNGNEYVEIYISRKENFIKIISLED